MILGIYGAGGHGREVLELARVINGRINRWNQLIFIDDGQTESEVNGAKVYSYDDAIEDFGDELEISVGVGEPATREKLFSKLDAAGIKVATLIHPDVHIPDTTSIGRGVTIQMGCYISCNVSIEDYVYIQPHANISHDDVLKKGCMISGMCNLSGGVEVGEFAYIGISACVREYHSIGNNSVIGMGSVVCENIPDGVVALGSPAKVVRSNASRRVFR